MARPVSVGLLYFPFDVGFFEDKKIRILRGKYGCAGIMVYILLLCRIYKENGYYTVLDDDLILCISDELNISECCTRQIISFLASRSLINILACSDTVITAQSIQRRFQEVKKGLRRDVSVRADVWLLEESETLSFIKVRPHESYSGNNGSYYGINPDKSRNNSTKKSKEKKSKEKKNKTCLRSPEPVAEHSAKSEAKPPTGVSVIDEFTENETLRTTIHEFLKMRRLIKKPLTDFGIKKMLGKLSNMAESDGERIAILEQSIEHSWVGIFPLSKPYQAERQDYGQQTQQNNISDDDINNLLGIGGDN